MSALLSGEESRTPNEKEIEKKYIVGMASSSLNREGHVYKSKHKETGFVKKNPEIDKHWESQLKQFARSIADDVIKGATEYQRNPHVFDSPLGTEFDFKKGENQYRVKRQEECWEVYTLTKVKKEESLSHFCFLPNNPKDISAVKIYMSDDKQF